MKHFWIAAACLGVAGCTARKAEDAEVHGISVTYNRPEVTVVKDHLYVNGFDQGAIKRGDQVVVSYCGISVNGEQRIAPP